MSAADRTIAASDAALPMNFVRVCSIVLPLRHTITFDDIAGFSIAIRAWKISCPRRIGGTADLNLAERGGFEPPTPFWGVTA